ncbi:MAG: LysR family transcriptional regulator [Acidimicrobiia bacterium]|nr:LysR family transcriptional regulator [Acidimicrobiia bacterium]
MDIRQLRVLLAVADHGSFSAAARELHTVQSNVSNHIARLERELGNDLINRSTGELTAEGAAVAARARRIHAEVDAIGPDLAAMRDEITGTVRIGTIGTVGRWLLPRLLERLAADYPLLALHVVDATTTSLAPQVSNGDLHLAIVNLPIDDRDLEAEPMFDEMLVLALAADDPLAKTDEITLADLASMPVLVSPRGTSMRDGIDDELRANGLELSPRAEIDGVSLLASMVGQGCGAGLLPASAVPTDGSCAAIPVRGPVTRSVGLISNRRVPPSATTRTVVGVLRELIADEAHRRPALQPHPASAG